MAGRIGVADDGPVRVITLDHAAKRNALDVGMCAALIEALSDIPDTRAVVLAGSPAGGAFCAGFDLEALDEPISAERSFTGVIDAVAAARAPVVCALGGLAYGGGFELAATCDLRVGHAGIKLAMPPARLGIVYPARGLTRFSALVGDGRARDLFLTARTLDGVEAHAWGLIDRLVDVEEVDAQARALAGEIAGHAPLAVQGMRRAFELLIARRATLAPDDTAELDRLRAEAWASEDAVEARRAHREKRRPAFRGRPPG